MPVKLELTRSDDLAEDVYVPAEQDCQAWMQSACADTVDGVASLRIVSRDEIRQLNNDYRKKDSATNVLSFPMSMPEELQAEMAICLLGDIAVCAEVIAEEAEQQGKTADAHWAHMLIHGMLHLQGYDHVDEADAHDMETLEIRLLQQLGFENPY